GSRLEWVFASGGGVARKRSEIAVKGLETGAGWLLFLDDDHTFGQNLLLRLLQHNVAIVMALTMFLPPTQTPILDDPFPVPANATDEELLDVLRANDPRPRTQVRPGSRGLIEVGHCGTGATLIKREVLEAIAVPHFRWMNGIDAGEDTMFCL